MRPGNSRVPATLLVAGLFGLSLGACQTASTTETVVRKPLSYMNIKYGATVRQRYDFSCGAATVATILTYYWGQPTDEFDVMDVLRSRYPGQDWKSLQDKGFSLDDLIWAANRLGYEAQAAALPPDQLEKIDGPIIVHVNNGVFEHFTVLRLRRAGRTYLSDPILGATSLPNDEFDKKYTGAALAIWKKGKPLPKAAVLAKPYPVVDPSLVIGGALGPRFDYFKAL